MDFIFQGKKWGLGKISTTFPWLKQTDNRQLMNNLKHPCNLVVQ